MTATIAPVPVRNPGNGGIVPPWLIDPPRILPMPEPPTKENPTS